MTPDPIPPERLQSILHPAGSAAERIADLWWFMFIVLGVSFLLVMGLLWIGLIRKRREQKAPLGHKFILLGGVAFPTVVVLVFLVYSLNTSLALRSPPSQMTIEVIGHQWWWEVRYPQHDIITANEIHIPAGKAVRLKLRSADVIHSFWVPNLHGKMDMFPDHDNNFWIRSDKAGRFRGQCAEYCGLQHARMAFWVVALERSEFDKWLVDAQKPSPPPDTPEEVRGQQVFDEVGCNTCHAIKGTGAVARIGPDLTHLADRLTLGAGTVPNNYGNLAGWIANPQTIKPGNLMPPSYMPTEDFHALLSYLEDLQ